MTCGGAFGKAYSLGDCRFQYGYRVAGKRSGNIPSDGRTHDFKVHSKYGVKVRLNDADFCNEIDDFLCCPHVIRGGLHWDNNNVGGSDGRLRHVVNAGRAVVMTQTHPAQESRGVECLWEGPQPGKVVHLCEPLTNRERSPVDPRR